MKTYSAVIANCSDCPFYNFISVDCVAHISCHHPNGPSTMPEEGMESLDVTHEIPPACPLPDAPGPSLSVD